MFHDPFTVPAAMTMAAERGHVGPREAGPGAQARRATRAHDAPHVGVLVERRYLSQAQPSGLIASLRARGCRVRLIDPQAGTFRLGEDGWLAGLDVLAARGRSWGVLCMLAWAEARGIPTFNRRAAIGAVHNKAEMGLALESAGVPVPKTFVGTPLELSRRLRSSGRSAPIVLKPVFGDNGDGVRLVHGAADLRDVDWPEPVALAQELVTGPGTERKLYGIGDDVWVVERPARFVLGRRPRPLAAAPHAGTGAATAVAPTPAELGLARYCRRIFGLELYGLDCIPAEGGPVVIEVNDFPNYTGVPDASDRLAEFLIATAQRNVETCA
jgi:ribosomal protein S6--L-glutamate ligase